MSRPLDSQITPEMVANHNLLMQRIDALMGKPVTLCIDETEYAAQRQELAELLGARLGVFA